MRGSQRGSVCISGNGSKILDDLLGAFGLACAGLATALKRVKEGSGEEVENLRDQDTLVLPLLAHVHPRAFGDCEYVGWVLITTFVAVLMYNGVRVQGQRLVWVDCNQEQSRVRLFPKQT